VVKEAQEWMRRCLDSPEYRESAYTRVLAGQAPLLERMWLEYTLGKTPDRLEVSGPGGAPLRVLEVHRPTKDGA